MEDLHGRHALVTGGSGALGGAVATVLVASGATVTAVARRRTRLEALRAELHGHERLKTAEADVGLGPEVEALFDAVERETGPLDAVVHAVGAFAMGPLVDATDATLEGLWRSNVWSATLVLRASLRRMTPRRRGRVVLVGGLGSEGPSPGMAFYGATKAALAHLVGSAARECSAHGVTVNAVLPGVMDTPDNRAAMPDGDPSRWVSTQTVAKAIAGLLGPSGEGVTGTLVRLPDRIG